MIICIQLALFCSGCVCFANGIRFFVNGRRLGKRADAALEQSLFEEYTELVHQATPLYYRAESYCAGATVLYLGAAVVPWLI